MVSTRQKPTSQKSQKVWSFLDTVEVSATAPTTNILKPKKRFSLRRNVTEVDVSNRFDKKRILDVSKTVVSSNFGADQ